MKPINLNKQPLISVLLPAYNHENYVEETLNSILKDNYPNKELVIIDDGSTDNTNLIIEKWINNNNSKLPINYKQRSNKGVTKTLNDLVTLSKGDYILFIHSDDYLLDNGIAKRYDYLHNHKDKLVVFADCIVVNKHSEKIHDSGLSGLYFAKKENYKNRKKLKKEMITNWSVPGGTLLVKKEVYDFFTYNEQYLVEDLDFFLQMSAKNIIGFLDEKVSAYRVHGKNTCFTDDNIITVYKNLIASLKANAKYFSLKYKFWILVMIIVNNKKIIEITMKKKLPKRKR